MVTGTARVRARPSGLKGHGRLRRRGTVPPLPRRVRSPPLTPEPLRALPGNTKGRPQPALANARCKPRNQTDEQHQTKILKHKVLQDHIHPSLYGSRGLPGVPGP